MIQLHYFPGNASFTPHVLLHEIGVPFTLQLVDRTRHAHTAPAYLRLNPNGLIPVLVDGDLVLYETAAICLYLVDRFPQARLAPKAATADRAHFNKWLVWMTNTLQATLIHYFYPERLVDAGNAAAAAQVKSHCRQRVGSLLQQIDGHLAAHGGPWFLGEAFTVLDVYGFMLCRWTREFADRPARAYPHIGPFLQRVLARPAVQRTIAAEGLAEPFV